MSNPAFIDKMKKGPVVVMTVIPNGPLPWGRTWRCGLSTV